ncbi:MAG TPA: aryl-sulfate sulfotransferase [Terriglobia bacterium]|nr:aryl-sulfate sulfotransferase [Terriglobia bacterium]
MGLLTSCSNNDSFSSLPDLSPGVVTPTANPLVAEYNISLSQAAQVYVQFGVDTTYGFDTSAIAIPAAGGGVTILVAGMKASTTYHMRAVVTYSDGATQDDSDHTFTTGTVDATRIPQVQVSVPAGSTPASGIELACLSLGNANQFVLAAFDPQGNLVWYYDYNLALGIPNPAKLLQNGHLLLVLSGNSWPSPGGEIEEIDLAGNIIRQFSVADLNQWLAAAGFQITVYSVNHDILSLPNGHLILLASEYRTFNNLTGYPGQTNVLGNDIIDLDPNDKPVWVWSAFDHLDVNRHPMLFPDWTHANALAYSQDDGNLLLSLRHQNWVIKIDYENGSGSGNILWHLGYEGDFTLDSDNPADWFYAQHDASILSPNSTGDFTLGVFDNGDDRVLDSSGTLCGSLGAQACYSRAAIVEVNEANMTAQVSWANTVPYSSWGGVTQLLPSGNVFIDDNNPIDNPFGAHVFEVTHDQSPETVWELNFVSQTSYRTIHLPSLYPGVQW